MSAVLASWMLAGSSQAQTAQELQIFNSLPSSKQQSILQSLGQGGGATPNSSRSGANSAAAGVASMPSAVPAQYLSDEDRRKALLLARNTPALRPGDTVLVSVSIKTSDDQSAASSQQPPANARDLSGAQMVVPTVFQAEPQVRPSSTPIVRSQEETERLTRLRDGFLRGNPYRLDGYGVLSLPGVNPIPLGGLSVNEAMERLNSDPLLLGFNIGITLLPVQNPGADSLKPFGYDLFSSGASSGFAPATDIPVPVGYLIGPGDTINVQLIGKDNSSYVLEVGRDGQVNFPSLGPITVAGMTFEAARRTLEQRVAEQMIGSQASITMGQLRTIQVFVLGEVSRPGAYSVSGLSTITNALMASGGVKTIGSLRNVQLKRAGRLVTTLDIYDLLLKGDARDDARVLPGDVVFIPPTASVVGIAGEVKRPAFYELKGATTVEELLALSGGLESGADGTLATLQRVDAQRRRIVLDMDITTAAGRSTKLQNGDVLNIPQVRPTLEDSILLDGYVYRPGSFQYHEGMRLTDLLPSVSELKPNADLHYVLIRRESPVDHSATVFSADLGAALTGEPSSNVVLQARDRVYVFDLQSGRDSVIAPLLRDLRTQSNRDEPTQVVRIQGKTNIPGEYPWEPNMRVSDLIRAGGGLGESAYEQSAELTRYELQGGEFRKLEVVPINLAKIRAGDSDADLPLQPFDYLLVKKTPLWGEDEYIDLSGEVRFPGRYPVQRGETLRSVLQRAGGLTELAFPFGAAFTRMELRERERQQIKELTDRMQMDLAQVSLQVSQEKGGDAGSAMAVGQALLNGLKATQPVGRLVIDIDRVEHAKPGSINDILLKNGDSLLIPRIKQEVTVLGEVQSVTSHLYRPGLSMSDYVEMSGGVTRQADAKHIYVVRANGSVEAMGSTWFKSSVDIKPGDTIVVPFNAYKIRNLSLWTSVTQIIYQMAIAAAAVNSF